MIKKKGKGIYECKPALQKTLEGILQTREKNKFTRPQERIDGARIIVNKRERGNKTPQNQQNGSNQ